MLNDEHPIFGIPTFILLVIFVSLSGFVGFWYYIKRALKHLDPSAVVPARVRNALKLPPDAPPLLIVANQPTWGLDVGAVAYVHRQLLAAAAAADDNVVQLPDRRPPMQAALAYENPSFTGNPKYAYQDTYPV